LGVSCECSPNICPNKKNRRIGFRERQYVSKAHEEKWEKQARKYMGNFQANVPDALWTLRPWTEPAGALQPQLRGVKRLPRVMALLDIAFLQQCLFFNVPPKVAATDHSIRRKIAEQLWVDLSQGIDREPWKRGPMPTCTTSSELYKFDEDQVVEPEEVLAIYGRQLPRGANGISRQDLQDLVGNSMAVQPLAAVLAAIVIKGEIPGLWEHPVQ
jgi:hypothetical protein